MHISRKYLGLALIGICQIAGTDGQAAEKEAPAKAEVRNVVQSQLEAFRKSDFKTAYGFAHSGVKEQFPQVEFEQMVRGGFPSMLLPGAMAFGEVHQDGANAEVQVMLTDKKGNTTAFRYFLEKQTGNWRIAAVIPVEVTEPLV